MAYVVNDDCITCGACAGACIAGAVRTGDIKMEIDADECVECGACAGVCPVNAIFQP